MPGPSATWDSKRVFITYRNVLSGLMEAGNWTAKIDVRITNTLGDGKRQVFRQGNLGSGVLNTTEGVPSLSIDLPIVDDPQNTPNGGVVTLMVTFASGGSETFKLSPLFSWPADPGTDLALILDPQIVAAAPPVNMKGVPGGVAALDAQGYVLNAAGQRITGGTGTGGSVNWGEISGQPAVVAAGSTQAAARTAIAVYSTAEVDSALSGKVNTSTYTTALNAKADLVSGTIPLAQIPTFTSSRISDFVEAVQDAVSFVLQAGSGITLAYDDAGNKLTITSTGGGTGTGGATINDAAASTSSVYSSSKVNAVVAAIINDAVTVTNTTWSSTKIQAVVTAAVNGIVNSAPGTLDTLNELSAALGNDPNSIITLTTAIGNRVRFDAAQTLTTGQKQQARTNIDTYSTAEVGNKDVDLVAYYTAAKLFRAGGSTNNGGGTTTPPAGSTTVAATVTPTV